MKRTASNMDELNAMLISEMRKAMNLASNQMLPDMYGETYKFYTKGKPKEYERTGALGDTPKVSPLTTMGNIVYFDAYLDTTHQYTTGKNPNMLDVLNLANSGITKSSVGYLRPTLGKKGFWEAAEKKIDKVFNRTMRKFFRKI